MIGILKLRELSAKFVTLSAHCAEKSGSTLDEIDSAFLGGRAGAYITAARLLNVAADELSKAIAVEHSDARAFSFDESDVTH